MSNSVFKTVANLDWVDRQQVKQADLKPDVTLLEHQRRLVDKVKEEPGVLAYWGLGAGKTLGAIAAAESLGVPTNVVVPAALRENFRSNIDKYVSKTKSKHRALYDIVSYNKALDEGLKKRPLTVFDEAHRMGQVESQTSLLADRASDLGKVLLLTGTPIRNDPSELYPLIKAIAKDRPIPKDQKEFDKLFIDERARKRSLVEWLLGVQAPVVRKLKNEQELKSLIKNRVDYQPSDGSFPKVVEEEHDVPMTPLQYGMYKAFMTQDSDLYYKVRKNLPPSKAESKRLNAYLAAVRQISNNPAAYDVTLGDAFSSSPKLQAMYSNLISSYEKDPKDFRAVVYSNYLDSGILPLAKKLEESGISVRVFTGELDDKDRAKIVKDYNDGKVKVLLISGAGAEGISLKGTQLVQIMEPHWNESKLDQAIGRAVRRDSHTHLPKDKQKVTVQRFYSSPLRTWWQRLGLAPDDLGADRYIRNRSLEKQQLVNQALNLLKEVSRER